MKVRLRSQVAADQNSRFLKHSTVVTPSPGDISKSPQWMPETVDNTKPICTVFSYTYITVIKLN